MLIMGERCMIRILHVIGGMNRGGIETWLMHVLRNIDRDHFCMDFLVHTNQPCDYDEEIRALGSEIIPCLDSAKPWLYALNFKRLLREKGSYDIVHSHVQHFNGYVLLLAKQSGVRSRIAHSHNDTSAIEAKSSWTRRLYFNLSKWWIARYATLGLAASRLAAESLFGSGWKNDLRYQVFYCAIDLLPFREQVNADLVRSEFNIPVDAFVIGHVGRLVEQKNPLFLVEIAAEVAVREPKMRLLLVGSGPLYSTVNAKVQQLGLDDRVIFAGTRSDVNRLMLGAMDVFLFPSIHEGLGLVLIEAQTAGLPCVLSDVVPEEAHVIEPLMQRLSLSQTAEVWSEVILKTLKAQREITQTEAYQLIEKSSFNIHNSVKQLETLYFNQSLNEAKNSI